MRENYPSREEKDENYRRRKSPRAAEPGSKGAAAEADPCEVVRP